MIYGQFNVMTAGEQKEEDEDETGEPVKAKAPGQPILASLEEIKVHKSTHQPCRSWRKHCVMGRSDDVRHRGHKESRVYPVASFEYIDLTQSEIRTACLSLMTITQDA